MSECVWMRWNLNDTVRVTATEDVVAALTCYNVSPAVKDGYVEIQGHALGDLLGKCPYGSVSMNVEIEVERANLRDAVKAALGWAPVTIEESSEEMEDKLGRRPTWHASVRRLRHRHLEVAVERVRQWLTDPEGSGSQTRKAGAAERVRRPDDT